MRIAIPNKGRLADGALDLLQRAGLRAAGRSERALQASLGNGFTALFVRARDIPEFVADGAADAGITGLDVIEEMGRELDLLLDLEYGRCRLVVAAHEDGVIDVGELAAGTRVATAFPRLAQSFFSGRGLPVEVVPISGAAEIAPHIGVAEVIVDLVSTGSTLKTNGLREVATILESSARLVARPRPNNADEVNDKLRELVPALESVLRARDKRYLMANVPRDTLAAVSRVLPGISGPTVVDVIDSGMVAAHAVVDAADVYRAIADLKELGATGILVTKIERLMP
ncbi:MAG: ATP phosphoribosyltransferase [Acidobacteriota bacterium]|jgi:ATP phosphoribosyltransferase